MTGAPFAPLPHWLAETDVSDRAIRVYLAVARRQADGGTVSRRQLANDCRCSVESVKRALRELSEVGAIVATAVHDETGARVANTYGIVR